MRMLTKRNPLNMVVLLQFSSCKAAILQLQKTTIKKKGSVLSSPVPLSKDMFLPGPALER